MTTVKITATVHNTDNGDGSTSAHFYNNDDHLRDELRKGGWNEDKIADMEDGDDPYGLGTMTHVTIELNLDTLEFKPFTVSSDG